jgi:VanZ family protein
LSTPPPPRRHGSAARPLLAAWAALIVYASLHPFTGWRWPGQPPWDLLWLPWPRHHQRFDIVANLVAYVPLGGLLAVALLRSGRRPAAAFWLAVPAGVGLSLGMEWLQVLLPMRVPSRLDWLLNAAGTLLGALAGVLGERLGLLRQWQDARERWFLPQPSAGLVLLLLWPVGLLFPPPVPFGLGHGLGALAERLDAWLVGSALEGWVPLPSPGLYPLSPGTEVAAVTLGLLAPCLVGFTIVPAGWRRLLLLAASGLIGLGVATLSTAMNFGPDHALAWLTAPVQPGFALALLAGAALAWASTRLVAGLGLAALTLHLALVNQAGIDPYVAQSLLDWAQGRFIRFHGLAQWVGWGWPYAALVYLATRLAMRGDG